MEVTDLVVLLVVILFFFFIYIPNKKFKVVSYKVYADNIPESFHRCRFVLLSDLHNNIFGKDNSILIEAIRLQNPDYIVIAGDMLVGNVSHDYKIAIDLIGALAKDYIIYYGNGNHEHRLSLNIETKDTIYNPFVQELEKLGVRLLVNEREFIKRGNSTISITGLQIDADFYKKKGRPIMDSDYLEKCIGVNNPNLYQILIAHNPVYFKEYKRWGANLVLAGHLHGGIIRIPGIGGLISPQYKFFPKYDGGIFNEEKSTMIISRGLGMHTLKIRLFNKPELVVFELKKNNIN